MYSNKITHLFKLPGLHHMKVNAKTFLIPLTHIYVKITVILKQAE